MLMFFPEKGDVMCRPVEIVILPGDSTVVPDSYTAPLPVPTSEHEKPYWRLSVGASTSEVVGQVNWEGDLELL